MPIRPSLLDRLIDDEPERASDPPRPRGEELRRIREGFRRDLEALLNTRRTPRTPPPVFARLRDALPSYGVEDFVGAPLATLAQRQALVAAVERTIATFEPRFSTVKVSLIRSRDMDERRQAIRIEAVAVLEHGPEPVVFESALDPTTRSFRVD